MAVVRCDSGHYYDDEKFSRCPHCGIFTNINLGSNDQRTGQNDERTVAMRPGSVGLGSSREKTIGLEDINYELTDDQKTVGYYSAKKGNDYVTGWLVCIEGREKGRDYRLHHGFNYVGRGYDMDVCIVDDQTISREKHCAIVYDAKSNRFSLVPSQGNLVYMGGVAITVPVPLKTGDVVGLGESRLEFIAFCREGRVWEKE